MECVTRKHTALQSILKCFTFGLLLDNGASLLGFLLKHILTRLHHRSNSFTKWPALRLRSACVLGSFATIWHLLHRWKELWKNDSLKMKQIAPDMKSDSKMNFLSEYNETSTDFLTPSFRETWCIGTFSAITFSLFPSPSRVEYVLFALVRAGDALLAQIMAQPQWRTRIPPILYQHGDTLLFVACCTEIMSAWFYAPETLPSAYVKWITAMSEMDERLVDVLRYFQRGTLEYNKIKGYHLENYLDPYCKERGLDPLLGNPSYGFIPCSVVHPRLPCAEHTLERWRNGFTRSFRIYSVLYLLPLLLSGSGGKNQKETSPSPLTPKHPTGIDSQRSLLSNLDLSKPIYKDHEFLSLFMKRFQHAVLSTLRSSAFLATFIATLWATVCTVRNLTHQDGPFAQSLGSFLCGWSILLERKSRRAEMALYCIPRALYSFIFRCGVAQFLQRFLSPLYRRVLESMLLAGCAGFVLASFVHQPESIRPSIRGAMGFMLGKATKKS